MIYTVIGIMCYWKHSENLASGAVDGLDTLLWLLFYLKITEL